MKVDVHAHYYPRQYVETLARGNFPGSARLADLRAGDKPEDLDERLKIMDAAGVGMQVLSAGAHGPYFASEATASDAARVANDTYAEMVERFPGRFDVFAATPLPHIDAALREMERAMDELKMVGIGVATTILNRAIADPLFEPFFAELDRRHAPLFIHPAGVGACSALIQDYGLTWSIGAPVEDTIVTLQLIVKQIPLRYPNVRIIIAHLGGAMPMLLDRLDNLMPNVGPKPPEAPSATARRLWYDTVDHNSIAALRCAHQTLGAERLVLGSDYPYLRGDHYMGCVSHIERAELPAADVKRVLEGNAETILGRKPSH